MSGWISEAKRSRSLAEVFADLEIGPVGRRWGPCPACGAVRDDHQRGAVRMGATRWWCAKCPAKGSVVDAVAGHLRTKANSPEVRAWFEDADQRPPVEVPEVPPAPEPPEIGEVLGVWGRCADGLDELTAGWLRNKGAGIDPQRVHEEGFARLPPSGQLPTWCRQLHWPGAHLVLPLLNHVGDMRGFVGRRCKGDGPKSVKTQAVRGFMLANRVAVRALRGCARPEGVLVVEGDADFMAAAIANPTIAVLGLPGSGAWQAVWAPALRDLQCPVYVRADCDNGGNEHTTKLLTDLPEAIDIRPAQPWQGNPHAVDIDELPPSHRTLTALRAAAAP